MKKTLLIVGGSHCWAHRNTKTPNDWISMIERTLDVTVKVMAIPGTSNLAVKLMLDHYLEHHPKPDYVVYEVMPCNRIDIGIEQYNIDINDISKNRRWVNSRSGHRYECGCEFEYNRNEAWISIIIKNITDEISDYHPNIKKWIEFAIAHDILPNKQDFIYPETSMLKLENLGIPYAWFYMDVKFTFMKDTLLLKKLNVEKRINTDSILGKSISPNHLTPKENKILFFEFLKHYER